MKHRSASTSCLTCRGSEGKLDKELVKAVEAFLTRADARTLPFPDKKARKSDVPDLQRAAFSAARASLKGICTARALTLPTFSSSIGADGLLPCRHVLS